MTAGKHCTWADTESVEYIEVAVGEVRVTTADSDSADPAMSNCGTARYMTPLVSEPEELDLAIDVSPKDIASFVCDDPENEEADSFVDAGGLEVSDRGWIDAAEEDVPGKDNAVLNGDPTDPADVLRLLDEDIAAKALHDACRQINGLKLETAWLRASLLALQMDLRAAQKEARAAGTRAKSAEAELWAAEARAREAEEEACALKNELWCVRDELLSVQGALRISQGECDRQQQQVVKAEAAAAKAEAKLAAAQVKEKGPSGRKRLALWSSHLEEEKEKEKEAVGTLGGEAKENSESWGMSELMEGLAAELKQMGDDNGSTWKGGERVSVCAHSSPVGVKKEAVDEQQQEKSSWADLFVLDCASAVKVKTVATEEKKEGTATSDETAGVTADPGGAIDMHLPSRELTSSCSSTESIHSCHSSAESSTASSGSVDTSSCANSSRINAVEDSRENRECSGCGSGSGRATDCTLGVEASVSGCDEGIRSGFKVEVLRAAWQADRKSEDDQEEEDECSSSYSPLTADVGDDERRTTSVENDAGNKVGGTREQHPDCAGGSSETVGGVSSEQQARKKNRQGVEDEVEKELEGEEEGERESGVTSSDERTVMTAEGTQQSVASVTWQSRREGRLRGQVGGARLPGRNAHGLRSKARGGVRVRRHSRWGGGDDRENAAGIVSVDNELADRIAMTVVKHLMTGRVAETATAAVAAASTEALGGISGLSASQCNLLAVTAANAVGTTTDAVPPEVTWASQEREDQLHAAVSEADLNVLGGREVQDSASKPSSAVRAAAAPSTPPACALGPYCAPGVVNNEPVDSEEELVAQAQEQLQGVLRSSPFFSSSAMDELPRSYPPWVDKAAGAAPAAPALGAARAGEHALLLPAGADGSEKTAASCRSTELLIPALPATISICTKSSANSVANPSMEATSMTAASAATASSTSSTPLLHATSPSPSRSATTGTTRAAAMLAATGRSISSSPQFPLLHSHVAHAPLPLLPSHTRSRAHADLQMRHNKAQLSLPFQGFQAGGGGGGNDHRMPLSGVGRRKSDSAMVQATTSIGRSGMMGGGVDSILWKQWWM